MQLPSCAWLAMLHVLALLWHTVVCLGSESACGVVPPKCCTLALQLQCLWQVLLQEPACTRHNTQLSWRHLP